MKLMYFGASSTTLERLQQSFEVVPLNLCKKPVVLDTEDVETWMLYNHIPSGIDAIVFDTDVKKNSVLNEALNYAICFSVPFILSCPAEIYNDFKATLEACSMDNKLAYINPNSKSSDSLVAFVMSTINMTVPYHLLECM